MDPPPDLETLIRSSTKYIQKYTGIANFLCKEDKMFLDISSDGNDNCALIYTKEPCDADDNCTWYKEKKCVNDNRIKTFGAKDGVEIVGKFGDKYISQETTEFHTFSEGWRNIFPSVYNFLYSEKDLYIIFNCGGVFDPSQLYEEEDDSDSVHNKFKELYEKIKADKTIKDENKIILCGHSMGSVVACAFGLWLFKNQKKFFEEKCFLVGSGSFRWLPTNDKKLFTNLNNVFIFHTSLTETIAEKTAYNLDPFANKPKKEDTTEFSLYFPVLALGGEIVDDEDDDSYYYNATGKLKTFTKEEELKYASGRWSIIHDWESYFNSLKKYFNFAESSPDGSRGGKMRNATQLKQFSKRQLLQKKKMKNKEKSKKRRQIKNKEKTQKRGGTSRKKRKISHKQQKSQTTKVTNNKSHKPLNIN